MNKEILVYADDISVGDVADESEGEDETGQGIINDKTMIATHCYNCSSDSSLSDSDEE